MRILVKNKTWMQVASFSEALASRIIVPSKIAVVGSGGKTSIIMQLAEEQKALGKKVLVLTTTHMYASLEYGVYSGNTADVENALLKNNIAIVGEKTDNGKIMWLGDELYTEIAPMADVILIEADGSKRLPLKFPNESEPVIPPDTDVILIVSGLSAIGRRGNEACHRWSLAKAALDILDDDEILRPEHLRIIMKKAYLNPLQKTFPSACVIPIFNQADDMELLDIGKKIIDELKPEMGIVSSILPL